MDAVSFDTRAEYEAIADIIEDGNMEYQEFKDSKEYSDLMSQNLGKW